MRIFGISPAVLAAAFALALSACGGGDEDSAKSQSNLPPIISGNPPTKLTAGTTYSFQPTAADPDGDALSFSAINLPGWANINKTSGLVSGTPSEADVGMYELVTIVVSDGVAAADLPPFQIEVASAQAPVEENVAPTIQGNPATQATVGSPYTFMPVAQDANGDDLTFSIVNKPSWATFTPATGALSGTPTASNVGTTSNIVISVSDGVETASLAAFSITVAAVAPPNRAPTISGTPGTSATVGVSYVFQPAASDPDGNTLQFSITGKPSWLNFSQTTGRLSGTPSAANVGSSRITITVTDGTLSTSLPAFTLQVVEAPNRAPVISGNPAGTATVGQSYTFTPSASDPDGDSLTFAVVNKPDWLSFNNTNGRLSGTPTAGDVGTYSGISISANDGTAVASLTAFSIVVQAAANGSATISWVAPTQNTDDSPLTDLSGYRLTYGRSSTQLDQSVNIDNPGLTTYTVTGLGTGTWYFALYARSTSGGESDMSNVAQKTIN